VSTEQDRRWRRFFLGKVAARPENPESLLYSYLTVPRFTVPRWYNEGSAVFFETWMGGGLGRAQGGLRRDGVPRDGARRRRVLRPAGARLARHPRDFQVGANAYLYGTRFFTWLA